MPDVSLSSARDKPASVRALRPANTPRYVIEVQYGTSRRGTPHARRLRAWAEHAFVKGYRPQATGYGQNRITSPTAFPSPRRRGIRSPLPSGEVERSSGEGGLRIAGGRPQSAGILLRIVGAAESRRLNRKWRGKDKPTNVLSFPAGPLAVIDGIAPLGDIVICAPVVRREAKEQDRSPSAHWAHMVVHGVLHLLGFDHERERDATVMERLEADILHLMGYADPYIESSAEDLAHR